MFPVKLCANYLCCALAGTASLTISESCSGCRRGCGAAPGGKSQLSASPIIRARWSLKSEFALPSAAARTGMILGLFVDVWQADCVSHLEFMCLRRSEMFAKALPHPGHKRASLRPQRGSGCRPDGRRPDSESESESERVADGTESDSEDSAGILALTALRLPGGMCGRGKNCFEFAQSSVPFNVVTLHVRSID